ncbi:MAG: DNA alkylation repair protein [Muribaculaceae bacterium]|nr:DNA alkylation repair protein [Muribaculaceae bacterium]
MIKNWQNQLTNVADSNKVEVLNRFFKTAPGEYGHGDTFIGITVPENRKISKTFHHASFDEILEMLRQPVHEFRLAALLALVEKYKRAKSDSDRDEIARFYISICHLANNWDLIDLSTEYILGEEILKGRHIDDAIRLCQSDSLWERRAAVVSTLTPVRKGQLDLAFNLCHRLIPDSEPLMRKAVGWVLRECGKKDRSRLETFLTEHINDISAITLSYAIEKFTPDERAAWRKLRNFR